jgi:hypothetical protein
MKRLVAPAARSASGGSCSIFIPRRDDMMVVFVDLIRVVEGGPETGPPIFGRFWLVGAQFTPWAARSTAAIFAFKGAEICGGRITVLYVCGEWMDD